MNKLMKGFLSLGLLALIWQQSQASGVLKKNCPAPCEPGYQWVEEVVYKDVPRFICKTVPNTQKKWVYCAEPDAFCIHKTFKERCHDGHCGTCGHCTGGPACKGPYCRKVLVKREIDVPCPGTKCVVEKIMEKVPCVTYRKVPCVTEVPGAEPIAPPKAAPAPAPTEVSPLPIGVAPTPTPVGQQLITPSLDP